MVTLSSFELLGSIVERDIACGGKFYEIFDGGLTGLGCASQRDFILAK